MKKYSVFFPIRWASYLAICFGILSVTGCVDLAAVRSFAKTSGATADYKQVPIDYATSAVRFGNFKFDDAKFSTVIPADRARDYKRFEQAQTVLADYMNVLGDLAADELPSVDTQMSALISELNKYPFITNTDKTSNNTTLTAAGKIATSLINVVLTAKRNKELRRLIIDNDSNVQIVTTGLAEVISKDFVGSLEDEKDAATSYFGKVVDGANDKALAQFLVRSARIEYAITNEARIKKAKAYAQLIQKIGEGHAQLKAKAKDNRLGSSGMKDAIKKYTDEIQKIYNAIKDLE